MIDLRRLWNILVAFTAGLIICFLISVTCGCSAARTQERLSETIAENRTLVMHDSLMQSKKEVLKDSVVVRDSVRVDYKTGALSHDKGENWTLFWRVDTVEKYRERVEYRDRERLRVDTLTRDVARTDTTYLTVVKAETKTVEVEKKLKWWQSVLIGFGCVFIVIVFIVAIIMFKTKVKVRN